MLLTIVVHQQQVGMPHGPVHDLEVIGTLAPDHLAAGVEIIAACDEQVVLADEVAAQRAVHRRIVPGPIHIDREIGLVLDFQVIAAHVQVFRQHLTGQAFHGEVRAHESAAMIARVTGNQLLSERRQVELRGNHAGGVAPGKQGDAPDLERCLENQQQMQAAVGLDA